MGTKDGGQAPGEGNSKARYDGHDVHWDDPSGHKVSWSKQAFEEYFNVTLPDLKRAFSNSTSKKGGTHGEYLEPEPLEAGGSRSTGKTATAAETEPKGEEPAKPNTKSDNWRIEERSPAPRADVGEAPPPVAPRSNDAFTSSSSKSNLSARQIEDLQNLLKNPGDLSNKARQAFNEEIRTLLRKQGITPAEPPRVNAVEPGKTGRPGATQAEPLPTAGEPVRVPGGEPVSAPEPAAARPLEIKGSAETAVTTALGIVGLVGGAMETMQGLNMVTNGQVGEGSIQTAAGIANATAGGATFFAGRSALAGNLAMRAGGVGAVLDGGLTFYQGLKKDDYGQVSDGVVRTGLGGIMLAGGSTVPLAGAAYGGWAVGRWIGGRKVGGKTIDQHVTRMATNMLYSDEVQRAQNISDQNMSMYERQQSVLGKSADQLKAEGKTAKDVSEAILGLREKQEKEREEGQAQEAQKLEQETQRLIAVRAQLA